MKKNKGIAIELTALLDVILIMLFWLLMNMKNETDNIRAEAQANEEAAEQRYSEAMDELDTVRREFSDYIASMSDSVAAVNQKAIDDFAQGRMITLNLRYDTIGRLLITDGNNEYDRLRLDSYEEIAGSIKNMLKDISATGESVVLCAFVYDGDRALYRDVKTVSAAIDEVTDEYGNFYCTYINISK